MYYAVIMAGGSGTRLWPASRGSSPKQALKLIGERTMFQYAVDRLTPVFPMDRILVVTREDHAPILHQQVPGLLESNFILEPQGRGTAPAIGLTAIHLEQRDPHATMALLTADHFITDTERFRQVLIAAQKVAEEGSLVTLGIQPSSPSTGFGYIKQGAVLGEKNGINFYAVQQFTEKPDLDTAQRMVASREHSWNSGMFIWQVNRILEEFERQMPEFYVQLMEVKASLGTSNYRGCLDRVWSQVKKETIDYGIMEGGRQVVVFPVEIGWTDIGSWSSLLDLLPADQGGNVVVGPHLGIDTLGTLVFGGKRLVATIGIENLIIIDSEDALLVCSKEREQDVRLIVDQLKNDQQDDLI
jgi:mannose-1-phosphate guanylyltransferase